MASCKVRSAPILEASIQASVSIGFGRKNRLRVRQGPPQGGCACGSGLPPRKCCQDIRGLSYRRPLEIAELPRTGNSLRRCYLGGNSESCSTKISREHYLSASLYRAIGGPSGKFTIRQGSTDERSLHWKTAGAKILCGDHNALLSGLDATAERLFKYVQNVVEYRGGRSNEILRADFLISGHDIERWLLKFFLGALHSREAIKSEGVDLEQYRYLNRYFFDYLSGDDDFGLFVECAPGTQFQANSHMFIYQFLYRNGSIPVGMICYIFGIKFYFFAFSDLSDERFSKCVNSVSFDFGEDTNTIWICWDR